ncbi:hypothetical protein HAX54_014943, partial [Datura stramonium]|nr:hypothetical protein [Datura stramonium]
ERRGKNGTVGSGCWGSVGANGGPVGGVNGGCYGGFRRREGEGNGDEGEDSGGGRPEMKKIKGKRWMGGDTGLG